VLELTKMDVVEPLS